MATLPQLLKPDNAGITEAARLLKNGGLVAFPTETVYGLGADATNDHAVARIFAAKGRPSFNPLISHFPSTEAVMPFVVWTPLAEKLATAFWPGPLTLVLKRAPACPISALASAGLPTAAVRVPSHPIARQLLTAVDRPIAAPSANRSNSLSPTEAKHVAASLGHSVDAILDGGPCSVGLESTVVDASGDIAIVLREGGVSRETLVNVAGRIDVPQSHNVIASPGMLAKHYAPDCGLRMNATDVRPGESLLVFGQTALHAPQSRNLSPAGDLVEAAANLFRCLHALNALRPKGIAVTPIPETGIGRAINDRLRRAAAD